MYFVRADLVLALFVGRPQWAPLQILTFAF